MLASAPEVEGKEGPARRHAPTRGAPSPPIRLGMPKSGLWVSARALPARRVYAGRANPLALPLVLGAAVGVATLGTLFVAPGSGLPGFLGFAALFAPVVVFVAWSAARLRTLCVIDRAHGSIRVRERSYLGSFEAEFALGDAVELLLATERAIPVAGAADRYGVYLGFPCGRYQVLVSGSERQALEEAERLGIFLGLPVTRQRLSQAGDGEAPAARPWRRWLLPALVYAVPLTLAAAEISSLGAALRSQQTMLACSGAIVLSQLGALLALAYQRARDR